MRNKTATKKTETQTAEWWLPKVRGGWKENKEGQRGQLYMVTREDCILGGGHTM